MLRFTLQTDVSQAIFERLRVERLGASPSGIGSNHDIAAIKVYEDSNFNRTFDGGDNLVSVGNNTFNLTDEADRQKEVFITTTPAILIANGAPRVFFLWSNSD